MICRNIYEAIFLSRPNRFIAIVERDGVEETVHVKNTGRCKELLVPGRKVLLQKGDNPARKTTYDLIAVYKPDEAGTWERLIHMDSQGPNRMVNEWLVSRGVQNVKPEYTYGSSRLDFYFEEEGVPCLMEVKGVTLEKQGVAYFPDAPTERGARHLRELTGAVQKGYRCYMAYVIQMDGVDELRPYEENDPAFAKAFYEAQAAGVRTLVLGCHVEYIREPEPYISVEITREHRA